MRNPGIIIGIDPDTERNGVAILDTRTRAVEVHAIPFAPLTEYLKEMHGEAKACGGCILVIIEAGWMNRSNWHMKRGDSSRVIAAKGVSQGRNEQVSRLIGEMCRHYRIPYRFQQPLRKMWRGRDGKITAQELKAFTGITARTNQETRDAALLAWHAAGFPIKITPNQKHHDTKPGELSVMGRP